ncbi:hypothetical protein Bca4012_076237 [Brassica carinata]
MTTCDGNGDFDFTIKARGVVEVSRVRMDRNEEISPPIGIIVGYRVKFHTFLRFQSSQVIYNSLFLLFPFRVNMSQQSHWITKSGEKKAEVVRSGLRISIPRFDNSEIIARYARTLIGRCMNPPKQDMKVLLFVFPRIWNMEGRVVGTDRGLGRFQFDFEQEDDITEILKMVTYHFDFWMVSLMKWKPEELLGVAGGGPGSDGAQATSYKAVVAHGIAYEKQGSSKQDGSFHPYKGKLTRGYGDGSSMNGRDSGYGERRRGMQSRGTQPRGVVPRGQHLATVAEGEQQLPDPSKLMLDAFKGAGKSSEEEAPIGVEAEGSGGHNKARKALMFEESSSVGHDLVPTGEGVELAGSLALKMQSEGDDAAQKLDERALHTQALVDANMMFEGELLSDSELLLEEGEELEDWEHGELIDVMEEEDQVVEELEGGDHVGMEANAGETDVVDEGKAPLKKGAKVGIGGTSKKRLGPGFVSPRKKLLAKVAAKAGDKGAKRAAILCLASWLVLWVLLGNFIEWRYLSEAVSWPGWTRRGGLVSARRWVVLCYGSEVVEMVLFWKGGLFSLLGYMNLNVFSALCVWYGFGFQMVSMETLEAEVGGMRFIYKPGVYFDRLHRDLAR